MRRDQDGFTLVELVMAVALMGVVVAAVAGGLVVMFTTTGETTRRLSESPDLQIASAYFGADVQSASAFNTQTCGPAALTRVASFSWTDPGSDPATPAGDTLRKVSYAVESVGNQKQLVRYACVVPTGASPGETTERTTLVDYLSPTVSPVATCPPTPGACAPSTLPATVELPLTVCTADASNACIGDPLEFRLRAGRRSS